MKYHALFVILKKQKNLQLSSAANCRWVKIIFISSLTMYIVRQCICLWLFCPGISLFRENITVNHYHASLPEKNIVSCKFSLMLIFAFKFKD